MQSNFDVSRLLRYILSCNQGEGTFWVRLHEGKSKVVIIGLLQSMVYPHAECSQSNRFLGHGLQSIEFCLARRQRHWLLLFSHCLNKWAFYKNRTARNTSSLIESVRGMRSVAKCAQNTNLTPIGTAMVHILLARNWKESVHVTMQIAKEGSNGWLCSCHWCRLLTSYQWQVNLDIMAHLRHP